MVGHHCDHPVHRGSIILNGNVLREKNQNMNAELALNVVGSATVLIMLIDQPRSARDPNRRTRRRHRSRRRRVLHGRTREISRPEESREIVRTAYQPATGTSGRIMELPDPNWLHEEIAATVSKSTHDKFVITGDVVTCGCGETFGSVMAWNMHRSGPDVYDR